MKIATPSDWRISPMPDASVRIGLGLSYTHADFERIRRGFIPEEMEDKWFIYMVGPKLYMHRSWTGYCLYVVDFILDGDRVRATGATVNRDSEQYSQTDAAADAVMIPCVIDALLLGRFAEYPLRGLSEGDSAIAAWSEIGRASIGMGPSFELPTIEYRFWLSDTRGLIRQRSTETGFYHPEIWREGRWFVGSAYVMDAITGMGEDPYSCGEWADQLTLEQAEAYAASHGIDLYAPNPDQPV